MHLLFGMHLDGTEWSPKPASTGEMQAGPWGLLDILETHTGLGGLHPHPAHHLLDRWGVTAAIEPTDLLEIHNRLHRYIEKHWPGCIIRREWPVIHRTPDHRLLQGRIDMLLETKDGVVIIDH